MALFYLKYMINAMILFLIWNFSFSDEDIPHATSYSVYMSQHIRFARVSSHVSDLTFNITTAKLL